MSLENLPRGEMRKKRSRGADELATTLGNGRMVSVYNDPVQLFGYVPGSAPGRLTDSARILVLRCYLGSGCYEESAYVGGGDGVLH